MAFALSLFPDIWKECNAIIAPQPSKGYGVTVQLFPEWYTLISLRVSIKDAEMTRLKAMETESLEGGHSIKMLNEIKKTATLLANITKFERGIQEAVTAIRRRKRATKHELDILVEEVERNKLRETEARAIRPYKGVALLARSRNGDWDNNDYEADELTEPGDQYAEAIADHQETLHDIACQINYQAVMHELLSNMRMDFAFKIPLCGDELAKWTRSSSLGNWLVMHRKSINLIDTTNLMVKYWISKSSTVLNMRAIEQTKVATVSPSMSQPGKNTVGSVPKNKSNIGPVLGIVTPVPKYEELMARSRCNMLGQDHLDRPDLLPEDPNSYSCENCEDRGHERDTSSDIRPGLEKRYEWKKSPFESERSQRTCPHESTAESSAAKESSSPVTPFPEWNPTAKKVCYTCGLEGHYDKDCQISEADLEQLRLSQLDKSEDEASDTSSLSNPYDSDNPEIVPTCGLLNSQQERVQSAFYQTFSTHYPPPPELTGNVTKKVCVESAGHQKVPKPADTFRDFRHPTIDVWNDFNPATSAKLIDNESRGKQAAASQATVSLEETFKKVRINEDGVRKPGGTLESSIPQSAPAPAPILASTPYPAPWASWSAEVELKCYDCGSTGHVARDCPVLHEDLCTR